jgi:hypothetical protein
MLRLVLKGKSLLEKSGVKNINQLALQARISPQTVYKYIGNPSEIQSIDVAVLATLLINGLGLTVDQIKDLRFGDVFDIEE